MLGGTQGGAGASATAMLGTTRSRPSGDQPILRRWKQMAPRFNGLRLSLVPTVTCESESSCCSESLSSGQRLKSSTRGHESSTFGALGALEAHGHSLSSS